MMVYMGFKQVGVTEEILKQDKEIKMILSYDVTLNLIKTISRIIRSFANKLKQIT